MESPDYIQAVENLKHVLKKEAFAEIMLEELYFRMSVFFDHGQIIEGQEVKCMQMVVFYSDFFRDVLKQHMSPAWGEE